MIPDVAANPENRDLLNDAIEVFGAFATHLEECNDGEAEWPPSIHEISRSCGVTDYRSLGIGRKLWDELWDEQIPETVSEADAMRGSMSEETAQGLGIIDLGEPLTMDNLMIDSPLKAAWACSTCGTVYQMAIRERTVGGGCPTCENPTGNGGKKCPHLRRSHVRRLASGKRTIVRSCSVHGHGALEVGD